MHKQQLANIDEQPLLLEINGLSKYYKDFQLENVNLALPIGGIMGFLGRNGAGKSTTMQAVMDLIKPDEGDIRILGMSMPEDEVAIKEQVGYVGDTPLLNNAWTVERTLQFSRHFYPNWDQEMVKQNLQRFGIPTDKRIDKFSKGMKVKASLILAMAHQPKLLLLDEPTSGLDPVVRGEVLEILLEFVQDENRGVLFSSHITPDVEKIADWVAIIDEGQILFNEDKESLLDRYRRIVISGGDAEKVIDHPLLFNCEPTRGSYVGYTAQYDEFQKTAEGEWYAERLTLEELFLLLTGRKEG
ncbi:ABC transporter ATP-binding protein [Virgibacillus sp. NKC19-16]|uniref:ABC transporter ATP-binding protein n=1 Tax=Virgibacillus salidurans TaxID=2831673 RepID=UPI001F238F7A|nr:ABC transporter ATP-binding protein [Virgibacillus sp. NKC19-16]UJL46176.1 ABC transporter ATP-binding protein [Virgibacillus sp. NKC19-16]